MSRKKLWRVEYNNDPMDPYSTILTFYSFDIMKIGNEAISALLGEIKTHDLPASNKVPVIKIYYLGDVMDKTETMTEMEIK